MKPFDEYGAGEAMPLGGYLAMMGLYMAGMATFLGLYKRRGRRLPRSYSLLDLALAGVATHELTRTISRERVTAPLRAPCVEHRGTTITGDVLEKPRGHGFRRAVGNLLTCPYCTGPWVAGTLVGGLVGAPGVTRFVIATF